MKKSRLLLIPALLLFLIVISVVFFILWLTLTDYRPEQNEPAELVNNYGKVLPEKISIFNWNLGYGGLGNEMDFFMDGGVRVRAGNDEYEKYWTGIQNVLKQTDSHFYLFQEIDRKSTRSYKEDQFKTVGDILGEINSSFATNYKVGFIPSPTLIGTQYGSVHSGLATYSQSEIFSAERLSLPGNFKWPKRVFFLDRCMLLSRLKTQNNNDLVIINIHTSAFDKGGFLKKLQLEYIKFVGQSEFAKGNYVVIGGDWNSYMPGTNERTYPSVEEAPEYYQPLPENWEIENWIWAVDISTPTNRSLAAPYEKGKTFTSSIDGFIVSPNVKPVSVKTFDEGFIFSDHNPIELIIELH